MVTNHISLNINYFGINKKSISLPIKQKFKLQGFIKKKSKA